jgi:hypothetical protein
LLLRKMARHDTGDEMDIARSTVSHSTISRP